MDEDTEVERLIESLAKALNWHSVELQGQAIPGCCLFEWKIEDMDRQLSQAENAM